LSGYCKPSACIIMSEKAKKVPSAPRQQQHSITTMATIMTVLFLVRLPDGVGVGASFMA